MVYPVYGKHAISNSQIDGRSAFDSDVRELGDSKNKGRQRVRMQYLLQPKRSDAVAQTTETAEHWECDVGEDDLRFGKALDEDVKIGVTLALAPPSAQNNCHVHSHILKSYA